MKGPLALLAVVALGLAASYFLFKPVPPQAPSGPAGTPNPTPTAPTSADPKAGAPAGGPEAADRKAIDDYFTRLGKTLQLGDGKAIGALFDFQLMFDKLDQQGIMPMEVMAQREQFLQNMARQTGAQFAAIGPSISWNAHEIRALRWLDDARTEAVVYVRTVSVTNENNKYRWWLAKRNGAWRTYDMENFKENSRILTMMGIAVAAGKRQEAWSAKMPQLMQASQAVANGDFENADAMLKQLDGTEFPQVLESQRQKLIGDLCLQLGRWQEAIDAADRAEKLTGDAPIFNQLRAAAYIELKQPEKALACAQKYIDLLGPDAGVFALVALARAQMGQTKEAEQAFLDGLKDDPQSFFCLLQYAKFLPKERKGEIAAPFAKAKDPDEMLDRLGKALSQQQDPETLLAVCAAYRAVKPASGKEKQYETIAQLLLKAAPAPEAPSE